MVAMVNCLHWLNGDYVYCGLDQLNTILPQWALYEYKGQGKNHKFLTCK